MDTEAYQTTKKIIIMICLSAFIIIAGGFAYYLIIITALPFSERIYQVMAFSLGVAISAGLNVLKIVLINKATKKTLDITEEKAGKNYVRLQFILRYLLSAAVLAAAAFIPFVSIWGVIIGLFTLHLGVFSVRFLKLDKSLL